MHKILEQTYPKSITTLCHTSFNRTVTPSLLLSISWTPAVIPFTPHYDTFQFPLSFVSVKASNLNFPFLKKSTTSSLFAVPFIPLTFHVPSRLTKFCRFIKGGSPTTHMDHTVNLFCSSSQGIRGEERRKCKFTMSVMLWDSRDMGGGSRRSPSGVCEDKKVTCKSARAT